MITVVVAEGPTSTTTGDVLPFQLTSPLYTAVNECVVVADSTTPASTAVPPLTGEVPTAVVPS